MSTDVKDLPPSESAVSATVAQVFHAIQLIGRIAQGSTQFRADLFEAALSLGRVGQAGVQDLLSDVDTGQPEPVSPSDNGPTVSADSRQAALRRILAFVQSSSPSEPHLPDRTGESGFGAQSALADISPDAQLWSANDATGSLEPDLVPSSPEAKGEGSGSTPIRASLTPNPGDTGASARLRPALAESQPRAVPPQSQPSVVPAPLTTARWDSGRRARLAGQSRIDPAPPTPKPAPRPAAWKSGQRPALSRSDSGRRVLLGSGDEIVRSIPATGWIPRQPASASKAEPASPTQAAPLTRRWELLSRFDSTTGAAVRQTPQDSGEDE